MSQRIELPYYFEVPEMPEIPFDVQQYFVSEQQRYEAEKDDKNQENVENKESRSLSANWYQSYIKVEEKSTQDKRDFKEVNLYEEVNFDLSKRMKEFLGDTLNLKFSSIFI